MKALQDLLSLVEATSTVEAWAVEMLKDAGLKLKPGPSMSDTGDGEFISDDEAQAAMKALKDAGHKKRTSGSWIIITHKEDPGKGMSFDYDNDGGQVAVRFFDRNVKEGVQKNRMYGMDAPTDREKLISKIESRTGTLESVPYHKISTGDLKKICNAVCMTNEELTEAARSHHAVIIGSEDRKDGTYYEIVEMGATYFVPREWVGGSQKVGSTGLLMWSDKKDQRGWHFSPK